MKSDFLMFFLCQSYKIMIILFIIIYFMCPYTMWQSVKCQRRACRSQFFPSVYLWVSRVKLRQADLAKSALATEPFHLPHM